MAEARSTATWPPPWNVTASSTNSSEGAMGWVTSIPAIVLPSWLDSITRSVSVRPAVLQVAPKVQYGRVSADVG